jgi:hypothetical protein
LEQIVATFFHNDPAQFAPAVQGFGRDHLSIRSRQLLQQGGGERLFAARRARFLIINADRLQTSVFVLGGREQADLVPNHSVVQGQSLRPTAGAATEPSA